MPTTKAKPSKRVQSEHVTIGNDELRCLHCGEALTIPMPISISVFGAMAQAWGEDHKHCKLTEVGAARMRYPSPGDWIRSWDTGMSSKTIFYFFMSRPVEGSPYRITSFASHKVSVPYDAGDFGRCYRLLKAFPDLGWEARLPELAEAYPQWAPFVAAWPNLSALYARMMAGTGEAKTISEEERALAQRSFNHLIGTCVRARVQPL